MNWPLKWARGPSKGGGDFDIYQRHSHSTISMLQRLVRLRSFHVLVDHQHEVFLFWFQSFYCSPTKEINPNMDNESFPMKTDGWCTWWWHCWIVAISSQHHIKHSWRKHHAAHKANDFSEDFWFSFLGSFWILVSNVFFSNMCEKIRFWWFVLNR